MIWFNFSCDCIISLTYKQADTALLNGSCNNHICRLVQYTTTGGQCYQVLTKAFIGDGYWVEEGIFWLKHVGYCIIALILVKFFVLSSDVCSGSNALSFLWWWIHSVPYQSRWWGVSNSINMTPDELPLKQLTMHLEMCTNV